MNSIVHITVEDFDSWKVAFDSMDQVRKTGGVLSAKVYRNEDNPNELFLILEWSDGEKARNFHGSDAFKQALQRGGVIDSPDISYVDQV